MRRILTRLLAGTAVAATAIAGAATVANASTPVKTPTTLKIAESPSTITVGQKAIILGALSANGKPLAKKAVLLDRVVTFKGGRKALIREAVELTNAKGDVTFVRKPGVGIAVFELVYNGNANYARSHSGTVTVTVKPVPKIATALSIEAAASSIKAGTTDTITGTLTAGSKDLAKEVVWLYKQVTLKSGKTGLAAVKVGLTNAKGVATFKNLAPKTTTTYQEVFYGTKIYARSSSATLTVTVTS